MRKGEILYEYFSDGGEPKGSTGQPILNALKKQNLINSAIYVIRYFGGDKMGIPRLIHAYRTSAENSIENAKLKLWIEKNNVEVILENFGEKIKLLLKIDVDSIDDFINNVKEVYPDSTQII